MEVFDGKVDVKTKAPRWLGYAPVRSDQPTEPEREKMDLFTVRLAQAWETAHIRLTEAKTLKAKQDVGSNPDLSLVVSEPDREAMRLFWATKHDGNDPELSSEGSKTFLGLVVTLLRERTWGLFTNCKAVSRAQEHIQR